MVAEVDGAAERRVRVAVPGTLKLRRTRRDDRLFARVNEWSGVSGTGRDGSGERERRRRTGGGGALCAAVRTHRFGNGFGARTLSVGAAAAPDHGQSYAAVLDAALSALARVQDQGRDGAAAMPPSHHGPLRRPPSIDRFAGRAQELASLSAMAPRSARGAAACRERVRSRGDGDGDTASATRVGSSSPRWTIRRRRVTQASVAEAVWRVARSASRDEPLPRAPGAGVGRAATYRAGARRIVGDSREREASSGCSARSATTCGCSRPTAPSCSCSTKCSGPTTSVGRAGAPDRQLDRDRIMICMTFRMTGAESAASADRTTDGCRRRYRPELTRQITIANLTRHKVKQWLEAAFHRQPVGRELLAFIYRHTEGNPLFIAHLLRALVEDGFVWHNGTRWSGRRSPSCEFPPAGRR